MGDSEFVPRFSRTGVEHRSDRFLERYLEKLPNSRFEMGLERSYQFRDRGRTAAEPSAQSISMQSLLSTIVGSESEGLDGGLLSSRIINNSERNEHKNSITH
jgi:hypothetical protein